MKRLFIALFVVLFALPVSATPIIGEKAPDFQAIDSNGASHNLSDFKGKTVVLEWTNHQCPFVKKHYETNNMQSLQKKYTDQGVVWLSVISSADGKQGHLSGDEANIVSAKRGAAPTAI